MHFWHLLPLVALPYACHVLLPGRAELPDNGRQECDLPALIDATVDDLREGLENGCFTSVELVKAYTLRIHEANPRTNAVLELNDDAVNIARGLDEERRRCHVRGPLHGLPVLIKDLIGTSDQLNNTAGSYALLGTKLPAEATVVTRLREQGLIILGKSSVSEWANFRSFNSSNGWNARLGQTYGAYYPEQDPSGSSSGSAVATDLGLATFALGTETSGSILLPSENSNIVGIKPTVGLTSRHMVIPISERQDTIGPLAKTVKDAAMLLQAFAGADPKDNYTLASPFGNFLPDYVDACKRSGLRGKRIGVPRNVIDYLEQNDAPIISLFDQAISVIESAGAAVIDDTNFTSYNDFSSSSIPALVVAADFTSNTATYLSSLTSNPNQLHSVGDIRRFVQQTPAEEYPSRDTGIWDSVIAAGMTNTSPGFWSLYQESLKFAEEGGLLGALKRHELDAVILPTHLAPDIPAILGTPVITVPMGAYSDGTPVRHNARGNLVDQAPGIPLGISFLGPKWSEEALIGMAYAFEQRTLVRDRLERHYEPIL
ncbi:putative amidase [Aspergillus homomorphus CBS 101889]|uniref:Amidase signature enzyme n=1 Tax=Aspergillus homomorphus (strain CBS 101889) TaxID=1450537 RepID=A0A395I4F2_ASPHC|nr:amidase signature enzyme [Aspergillus homomorphus CBS 101889]RAL14473.1 amidase signature enzyme [Aspergillus homomorphus CBS 101889]